MRPPSSSVKAGAAPLNGTCSMVVPASMFIHSPSRWCRLPGPAEEKLTLPGAAFARAIRSGKDLIGDSGATEITIGYSITTLTMPKPFTGS